MAGGIHHLGSLVTHPGIVPMDSCLQWWEVDSPWQSPELVWVPLVITLLTVAVWQSFPLGFSFSSVVSARLFKDKVR